MTEAAAQLGRFATVTAPRHAAWYQLADGVLGINTDDRTFGQRFQELYAECERGSPDDGDASGAARVRCTVRTDAASAVSLVAFQDPEPLDQLAFTLALFPARGYHEIASPVAGWRLLDGPGVVAFSDRHVLTHCDRPWQRLVANLAVNRVLRLQRDTLFFHAAAVSVRGSGVALMGPKGTGKTTLSLAVASHGHGFLGDEIVGFRVASRDLIPLRRAAYIRPGPAAGLVRAAVTRAHLPAETFPDGSVRWRAHVGRLLGTEPPSPVPLWGIVFLRGFGKSPRLTRLHAGRELLPWLTPLACSLWGSSAQRRALQLMQMLSSVPCFALTAGPPDDTAELVAALVEDR